MESKQLIPEPVSVSWSGGKSRKELLFVQASNKLSSYLITFRDGKLVNVINIFLCYRKQNHYDPLAKVPFAFPLFTVNFDSQTSFHSASGWSCSTYGHGSASTSHAHPANWNERYFADCKWAGWQAVCCCVLVRNLWGSCCKRSQLYDFSGAMPICLKMKIPPIVFTIHQQQRGFRVRRSKM